MLLPTFRYSLPPLPGKPVRTAPMIAISKYLTHLIFIYSLLITDHFTEWLGLSQTPRAERMYRIFLRMSTPCHIHGLTLAGAKPNTPLFHLHSVSLSYKLVLHLT